MAQVSLQELRVGYRQSQSTTFSNAATGAWSISNSDANCIKLRIASIDKGSLAEPGIADETLQTRLRGAPAPFKGLRTGSLKVSVYNGGSSSTATAAEPATLLSKIFGAIGSPLTAAKTFAVGSGSNASNIVVTDANTLIANGAAVLIGGEARIATNVQAGYILLNMGLSSAPAEGTNCSISHSVYFDESATQAYLDWLALGKSTSDQRQGIGCQATAKFSGMAPGEAPKIEIELLCSDHQVVPANERASLTYTSTGSGNDPPTGKTYGGFLFADAGEQVARDTMRAASFTIDPGIAWTALADPNGPNAIGGWLRNKHDVKGEFTVAMEEDHLGLIDDFENKTAKQLMLQLGTAQNKTILFYMPRFFLDAMPTDAALNNEAGLKITGHGDDDYDAASELLSSSLSVHYL